MGRKGLYAERPVKGPGRKTKKQGDPELKKQFKAEKAEPKSANDLSHRQKQRLFKRSKKSEDAKNGIAVKTTKPKATSLKKRAAAEFENADSADEIENYESSDFEEEDDVEAKPSPKKNGRPMVEQSDEDMSELSDAEDEEADLDEAMDAEDGASDEEEDINEGEEDFEDDEDDEDDDDEDDDDEDEDDEDESQLKVQSLADFSGEDTSDSESEEADEEVDNNDEDDDLLPIEKANKRLRIKKEKDAQLASEELRMNEAHHEVFQFPDEKDEEDAEKVITLQDIQQRIKDVTLVLSEFNKYRQEGRSRHEYVDLLRKDLCLYYSYNEFLMEKLMDIFPINELMEYLEASEVQRPITIRTNSLKTRRRDLAAALISRGVNLDPLGKWTKVGLVVYNSSVPLGATPEYLAGHYMIQGASSMLPVMALAPQENERILDMCSAPGGKSSHIASLMKNTGVLFSNDANRDRIKAVVGNFHRLGVVNAIVSHEDGCKFGNIMTGFDRILLDAPCTGTGVVAKDPSVKTTKTDTDIQRCYNLQRKLLLSAIDCLSAKSTSGGYLVYSTCSILPEENEWVVDYALKTRNVKLVPTGLDFGTEGFVNYKQFRFHPSMKHTRRYYPHTHNMDGFFVAKLKKFSDVIPANSAVEEEEEEALEIATSGVEGEDAEEEVVVKAKKTPEELALKKRKREKEAKNYVAKVFEAAPKVKKVKLDKTATKTPAKPTAEVAPLNKIKSSEIVKSKPVADQKTKKSIQPSAVPAAPKPKKSVPVPKPTKSAQPNGIPQAPKNNKPAALKPKKSAPQNGSPVGSKPKKSAPHNGNPAAPKPPKTAPQNGIAAAPKAKKPAQPNGIPQATNKHAAPTGNIAALQSKKTDQPTGNSSESKPKKLAPPSQISAAFKPKKSVPSSGISAAQKGKKSAPPSGSPAAHKTKKPAPSSGSPASHKTKKPAPAGGRPAPQSKAAKKKNKQQK